MKTEHDLTVLIQEGRNAYCVQNKYVRKSSFFPCFHFLRQSEVIVSLIEKCRQCLVDRWVLLLCSLTVQGLYKRDEEEPPHTENITESHLVKLDTEHDVKAFFQGN